MNYLVTQIVQRERASELLARYPRVSEDEAGEILQFLRAGRHLDIGLLSSDDRLRPKLDSFMHDHKAHFRVSWREVVAVLAGIVVMLITAWLIWAAFADAAVASAQTA
jgi:hypothetical protein